MITPKVSVIIPVYGVGAYIRKCVRSLYDQTLDDVEYIFVNDCTPDDSISVVESVMEKYPVRKANTKIINLPANGGVANARTVGMQSATGQYMIHCDPDDYMDLDCLETLYGEACKADADVVVCDYYRESGDHAEYVTQHYSESPQDCIKNFYRETFFPSFWGGLIRTAIIKENEIYPYRNINTGEDLNVIFRVFLLAKSLVYVNKAFYHYIQREGSLTQDKNVERLWHKNIRPNLVKLSELLDKQSDGKDYERTKHYLQYTKKLMLLQCQNPNWQVWYNEYKDCVKSLSYFKGFSSKHKFVMKMFAKHYFLLAIYYKVLRPIGLRII